MDHGRVEQVGSPEEVYRRPSTAFVARFLGRANFLAGVVAEIDAGGATVALDTGASLRAARREGLRVGDRVHVALRQESIRLVSAADGRPNRFPATVVFHAFAGPAHHYVVQLDGGRELEVVTPSADLPVMRGTGVHVEWAPDDVILLPRSDA
jgi:ABC-type Fe3+/spermidine/putrescine transport system ATPase subunit